MALRTSIFIIDLKPFRLQIDCIENIIDWGDMKNPATLILIILITGYGSAAYSEQTHGSNAEEFVSSVASGGDDQLTENLPWTLQDLYWLHVGRELMEKGETEKAFLALCNISSTAVSSVRMVLGDDAGNWNSCPLPLQRMSRF